MSVAARCAPVLIFGRRMMDRLLLLGDRGMVSILGIETALGVGNDKFGWNAVDENVNGVVFDENDWEAAS